jgi:tetratricopeptide (TPR) repeat protein
MALAEQLSPTAESQVLFNTALSRIKASRYHEALAHLSAALRIAPANPEYLSYYGLCIAHVDRQYHRALKLCQHAVDEVRDDPVFRVNLSRVLRLKGDNRAAYEQLQRAWRLDRRHPVTAAELTRMGIRRPPFIRFLSRQNILNRHLGRLRAMLERKLVGRRQL